MWVFEEPGYLLLFTLFMPAIYFCHFYKERGGLVNLSAGLWNSAPFKPQNRVFRFVIFLSSAAFWIGVALLFFALAGPTFVEKEKIYLSRGIDIMFVLDESPSMAAKDFPPENRFETAKTVIRKFINSREHDPIGLVTFADNAALRIPPTLDMESFNNSLSQIELMELGNGTAIGTGIAVAALHLKKSTATEKIIILITDGENNAGEIVPESAAEIAAKMNIRIYTIGVGSMNEVPIEYFDRESGKIISGHYKSNFDEKMLNELSKTTKGKYYYANSSTALESILSNIDSLENVERRVKIKTKTKQYYRECIFLGVLLITGVFFIRKIFFREIL